MGFDLMAPLMFAGLVIFLLLGYPVAFSLAANGLLFGLIGIAHGNIEPALLQALPERVLGIMANSTLLAIPFFTFMGLILERSGMAEDLLDTVGQLFGAIRGGVAFAVIFVGALLAATTGVVAASGGNHGVAVAWAAMKTQRRARIFVPEVASAAKIERIRGYGADLVITGQRYNDALIASEQWVAESGAMAVHAYEQYETLLGQGSVGIEYEQQDPALDTLLVACGGGGLIGGIAAWYQKRVRIIGVEPTGAPTLFRALEAGRPVECEAGSIAADSLAPNRVGEIMFPLAQQWVERVVLVEDDDIRAAQAALWATLRIVTEPGGAAAFAALLRRRYQPAPGERVGVLLCGANTTAVNFL